MTAFTKKVVFAPLVIGSLNLLAILLFFLQYRSASVQQTCLRQFLPSEDPSNLFNGWATLSKYDGKKQFLFDLRSPAGATRIQAIRSTALAIKTYPGSGSYIRVCLDNSTSYQDIVSLIDLMYKDDHERYMIWENSFYIFPPEKTDPGQTALIR